MASARTIIGVSIAVHATIAVWALSGDPPEDRPILAATSGRIYMPDVEQELVFDADHVPDFLAPPAVAPPAVAPPSVAPSHAAAPAPAPAPAPALTHPHRAPSQLAERSPQQVVDGLFADQHGLGPTGDVSRRRPGADLQQQIDEARRHGGTATIGGGDPRLRGDDRARTGTSPDCACLLPPVTVPSAPPPELPPVIHVVPHQPQPTTLTPDEVLRIITTQYMQGLQRCQHELYRRDVDARGKVTLDLTIDGDGQAVSPAASGVDDGLDRCIETRAGGWRFPTPHDVSSGAATSAHYRVSLALQAE